MALTGLDIYKLLPRTNCGDCGVPTCLAFAMKVAAKQAAITQCPHVSDAAQEALGAASQPPQKLVTIGAGERALKIGNETVMFRHDERFHHPCGLAVLIGDGEDVPAAAGRIRGLSFERMGERIGVNVVALTAASGDGAKLKQAAQRLHDALGLPMVLIADAAAGLAPAAEALAQARPLLWETGGPSDEMVQLAARLKLPLVVEGSLDKCEAATQRAKSAGVDEMLLCPGRVSPVEALGFLTVTRRAALRRSFRPLGYPVLVRAWRDDPVLQSLEACQYVDKYAGLIVMSADGPEYVMPVLVARQDIYINPQVPVQVEAKVHEVNSPTDKSPLIVTTNFSLTYYSVLSEVEASRVPTRILTVDTEGTSVLTAWAADKFGPQQIKDAIGKSGVFAQLAEGYRKPIIPGLVAVISGELQEELGTQVIVGPKEASGLSRFLTTEWPKLVG